MATTAMITLRRYARLVTPSFFIITISADSATTHAESVRDDSEIDEAH